MIEVNAVNAFKTYLVNILMTKWKEFLLLGVFRLGPSPIPRCLRSDWSDVYSA